MTTKSAAQGYTQAQLACGHIVRVNHNADGIGLCPFDSWQTITREWVREWRWRCPRCRSARWVGQDKDAAHAAAARHQRRYPGHVVIVEYAPVRLLPLPRG